MPRVYNGFVDDTFSITESERSCRDFFYRLKGLHPALQFTMHMAADNKLPFLDVLVQRLNGQAVRSMYRQPTFTGLYTRWDSFVPTSQKIGLIKSLSSRVLNSCSKSTVKNELAKLKNIFAKKRISNFGC